jgi:hypothetical protein
MNKNREKALEGLTRIAQVIISDKYRDESNEVLMFSKAIERKEALLSLLLCNLQPLKSLILYCSVGHHHLLIERIVASKGAYLPKTHKDTVLSMSISDEDTDAGSDFIELQPISEYEETSLDSS